MNWIRPALVIPSMLLIIWADLWLPKLYEYTSGKTIKIFRSINEFETTSESTNNKKTYKILLSTLSDLKETFSVAIGRFYGDTSWFCESLEEKSSTNKNRILIQKLENGSGSNEYGYSNIPLVSCQNLIVEVSSQNKAIIGRLGWRSGSTVIGPTPLVFAFKNISDFFTSYIRALLGLLVLLFLLFEAATNRIYIYGSFWYRRAAALLAIHFFASSSVLDFLLPGSGIFGFPLLKAGGSGGFIFLCVGLLETTYQKQFQFSQNDRLIKNLSVPAVFLTLLVLYIYSTGPIYINIQTILALTTIALSIGAKNITICFNGLLFLSDILAVKGYLPGMPSNTATHFFILNFLYDAFEWTLKNNHVLEIIPTIRTEEEILKYLNEFKKRFSINRLSYSYFSKDGLFKTHFIEKNGRSQETYKNRNLSRVSASVMTSRAPLLRLHIKSRKAKILNDSGTKIDKSKGYEYCVFPLIHGEKVIGTINITGYPQSKLTNPPQMVLFLSLIDKIIPKFSEILYRKDLSPNVDDEIQVLEIESKFSSATVKTRTKFIEIMDELSQNQDIKIILSKKLDNANQLQTFTNHNYSAEDSQFLDRHAPKLSETIVSSPANLAYMRREPVFVNDVKKMFSVYPEFLVSLLKRNDTKYLWAAPVFLCNSTSEPWGIIWIESSNKIQRTESDLRELIEVISKSIERQIKALITYESSEKFKSELGALIPRRVLQKIELGINPREEETGFLLNIDLTGSTKLAAKLGDINYSLLITEINLVLTHSLSRFNFHPQIIIWDAFIFTCSLSKNLQQEHLEELAHTIRASIESATAQHIADGVSFRAILHYGDTTRDLKPGPVKSWGVVGTALAESCKFEATIKHLKGELTLSEEAKLNIKKNRRESA